MTTPTAHLVAPDDERRHPPDTDRLWNESYYADFVHEDGTLGGWIRLGLYPNRRVAWWTTWIVGPDRPGVCSVDYHLPVPAGDGLVVREGSTRIALSLVRPLEEFRIAASAPARILERPEDAYGDESGAAAELGLDLVWTTDGTPYHYDVTTRYEIPCTVAGTVSIDGVPFAVHGQGQRDHSWDVRDWWAFGVVLVFRARLDDGTRVHLVEIRMRGFPVALGYVQACCEPPAAAPGAGGDEVRPVTELSVREDAGPHGLPRSARIVVTAGTGGDADPVQRLCIDATPVAFGPVLLRNDDDGRTSRFPRALVRDQLDDGRAGTGWIEWNQPDPVGPPGSPA